MMSEFFIQKKQLWVLARDIADKHGWNDGEVNTFISTNLIVPRSFEKIDRVYEFVDLNVFLFIKTAYTLLW